jgi:hypothetical protein
MFRYCARSDGCASPPDLEQNARALERLGLDESEMAKIRFENATKLFGLRRK